MRKLILIIAAFAFVGTAMAQNQPMSDAELAAAIVGKYTSKNTESNPGGGRVTTESVEVYGEDGTYSQESTIVFRMTIPANQGGGSIYVEIATKMEGTYSIDSAMLNYTIDPMSFEGEIIETGGGEYDNMVADQLMASIDAQREAFADPEKVEELKQYMRVAIFSINEKQMVTQNPETKKKTVHKRVKE